MKNLLKKNYFIPILLVSVLSCVDKSTTEDVPTSQNQNSFFNFKVGNLWVYKTYDRHDYTSNFNNTGKIDSLKVIGSITQNQLTYSKIEIKSYQNNSLVNTSYSYWRINSKGYWAKINELYINQGVASEDKEIIAHPGNDLSFTKSSPINPFGVVNYKMKSPTNISVENSNYYVYPFKGDFVANSEYTNLESPNKYTETDCQKGIGKVYSYCCDVSSPYNYEERLISFKTSN